MARKAKSSRAPKNAAPSPPTSNAQKPNHTASETAKSGQYGTSYADSLLPEDERTRRYQRVAVQKAQMTRITESPEEHQNGTRESVESDGMDEDGIDKWQSYIFDKLEAKDDDDEEHELADFL